MNFIQQSTLENDACKMLDTLFRPEHVDLLQILLWKIYTGRSLYEIGGN